MGKAAATKKAGRKEIAAALCYAKSIRVRDAADLKTQKGYLTRLLALHKELDTLTLIHAKNSEIHKQQWTTQKVGIMRLKKQITSMLIQNQTLKTVRFKIKGIECRKYLGCTVLTTFEVENAPSEDHSGVVVDYKRSTSKTPSKTQFKIVYKDDGECEWVSLKEVQRHLVSLIF